MIFKQWKQVLGKKQPIKTQTRRAVKDTEHLWIIRPYHNAPEIRKVNTVLKDERLRVKWEEGRTYAVVPKRGARAVWWRRMASPGRLIETIYDTKFHPAIREMPDSDLLRAGYLQARIKLLAIRQEPLQDITHADALAEGVGSVEEYRELWDSINNRKGLRWDDNPLVWVLTFEAVKD